jgi:outer membrane protein assembly factor BamB
MKPYYGIFLLIVLLASCKPKDETASESATTADTTAIAPSDIPVLKRVWETPTSLTTAESVLFDEANNILYVSCIGGVPPTQKDKDGFIAMVSTDGKIITEKWVTGLSAPKGMGLLGTTLFVTDIDRLVAIDTKTGKVIKSYDVKGAEFLNDVTTTADGIVYFTDSNTSTVYKLAMDKIETVRADTTLGGTNGITLFDGKLYLPTFMSGQVHRMDPATGTSEKIADGIPGGDGIERFGNGFLVSNWNGEVYYLSDDGKVTEILDTQEAKLNAADIEVLPGRALLLVPTFFGNTVTAYEMTIPM